MKKDVVTVLLMVIAVVFGVGLRYYVQNGSLIPQEQTESAKLVVQEKASESVSDEMTEEMPEEVSKDQVQDSEGAKEEIQDSPDNDWGVVLSAIDVTPDGMMLVCSQSGGNPTGELSTGAMYEIEVSEGGQWEQAPVYAEVCWEDIAWIIPADDTTQWEVNWTWIYGTLPAGEYRIAKEITDFRQTGDFDICKSYAYFTIE